jgi:hypothetical protein
MLPLAVSHAPANCRICVQSTIALTWSADITAMMSMIMQPTINQARSYLPED